MTCRISRFQDSGSLNNYITIFLAYVFKLVCTRWENFIRIGITVLYLKSCRCQLWIWLSQISVYWLRFASKTDNCDHQIHKWHLQLSNTVLLFLNFTIYQCIWNLAWQDGWPLARVAKRKTKCTCHLNYHSDWTIIFSHIHTQCTLQL
jgi:hypothetical protein